MPDVNPFVAVEQLLAPIAGPDAMRPNQQPAQSISQADDSAASRPPGSGGVNPYGSSPTAVNAAGTSENVSVHLAVLVVVALVGVYVQRAAGFRFVVAAGFGGAR